MLLISETHDPATPLQNGMEVSEMLGWQNSRLGESSSDLSLPSFGKIAIDLANAFSFSTLSVIHHGYGHSSRDSSNCTNEIIKNFFVKGQIPEEGVTDCYADSKPFDK